MFPFRQIRLLCVLALVGAGMPLVSPAADARAPLSNEASRLAACQDVVRSATLRLGDQVRRRLGRCIEGAVPCLFQGGNPTQCCLIASIDCEGDLRKIETELGRFRRKIERRTCENVPFEDVLSASGLGYEAIAGVCGSLQPPITLATLPDLTDCLAEAVQRERGRVLATLEIARGCAALECMQLDLAEEICTQETPTADGGAGR